MKKREATFKNVSYVKGHFKVSFTFFNRLGIYTGVAKKYELSQVFDLQT